MANFRFIRRKKNRFVSFISNYIWIAFIFTITILFMVVMVCYDGDDAHADVNVVQNRQILEEKQGLQSREDELLGLAAKLEKELFEHQERIKRRLETLRARKEGGDGRRGVDSPRHHHHHQRGGEGNEHRLKRRLMDARSSHGLGGGGEIHGPFVGQSGSSSISAIETTRGDQSIPGVKAGKTNKTGGIFENTLENGSLAKAGFDVNPPGAKSLPEKVHNESKLGSYNNNMKINIHQSIMIGKNLESLHESQKLNNLTKGGSLYLKKSRNSTQTVLNDQSWNAFKNENRDSLAESGVISTNAAATTILQHPSGEDQPGEAAVMVSDEPLLLGCKDLAHVNSREQVGSGYTKRVEKVELKDGRWVAVKSVWTGGKDVTACLEMGMRKRDCIQLANYKLMKEIALLQQLRHPNIIKLLGFCVKDDVPFEGSGSRTPSSLTIVERGTPLTFIDLLQMPWEDRLRVCLGISRLMVYLADSPLGDLAVHDFKLSQFVMVDGEIKLADLDDVDDNLSPCSSSSDCGLEMGTNNTVYTSCRNGVCSKYSQMSNMAQSYLKFFTYLQLERPPGMGELIGQLINHTKRASWTPGQCLQHMQTILQYYQQGKYMDQRYTFNINDTNYKVYYGQNIIEGEDYWCPGTRQLAATCVLSVHDEREAIRMCLRDRQCGAFVLTSERTWTGRYLAYFKKGYSKSTQPGKGNTVYVFPT